ncbi:hypothetical protein BST61_g10603 [Cercospora zeina]
MDSLRVHEAQPATLAHMAGQILTGSRDWASNCKLGNTMYIGGGLGPFRHDPVHETITLTALTHSDFKLEPTTTYITLILDKQAEVLEFLRGVVWNDDPSNLLFNNRRWFNPDNENYSRGIGKDWAKCSLPTAPYSTPTQQKRAGSDTRT